MFEIQTLAYLCVTIANSKGMLSFLTTTLSLLIAFSSGLFVPREFVSPFMQQLASFATPVWQVKGTELIMDSASLTFDEIQSFYVFLEIQILIGLAFYSISFVVQKYRQQRRVY